MAHEVNSTKNQTQFLLAGVLSPHWDAASYLSLSQEALHEGNTEQTVINRLAKHNIYSYNKVQLQAKK